MSPGRRPGIPLIVPLDDREPAPTGSRVPGSSGIICACHHDVNMTEPRRIEAETSDEEDFVWPLPVSSGDIVWLEPSHQPPRPSPAQETHHQAPPVEPAVP